eukprot:TRINITY_DN2583_c0_g1_i2.p1 TRINITY_DN2583_c0_g1~~TRINITY_DN2583_c0_g1_i2.p1  ORF type:complete len:1746 (-),score=389.06 TRINITY_DN2583_c0_g1_i2:115-5352(-)
MAGEGEAQLAVVGAKGLPDVGCVLSLKLGNSRRQGPYPCKETFKLSTWPCAMQIDVLRLIGRSPSATSGLLKEYALASAANGTTADDVDDFTCRVPLQSADGRAMSLTLKVCKPQAGAAAEAKTDALDLQDPSRLLEEKEFCWGYLESNGLKEFLQECFEHLMVERPPDPYGYLASRLQAAAEAEQRGEAPSPPKATASSPPAVPSRRPVPRPPSPQGEGPVKAAAPRRISFADEEAEDGDDDVFKKSCAPAAAASPIHALGGLASDTPTASGFARSAALRRRAAATLAQAGRNGTLGEALRRVPQLHTLPRPEGASVPASASSRRGNGAEAPSGERLRARARATLLAGSRDGQLGKALVKLARNPALGKVHTLVGCEDPASTPDGIVPERARELKQRARLALQEGQHAGALGDTLQRIPQLPVLSVGTSGYDGGSAKSAVAAAAALRLRARAAKTLLEGWRQGQLTDALQRTPQLVTLPKPENSGDAHSFAEGGKAARRPASRVPPGRAWNLRARACKALREANTSGRLVEALSRTPQLHTLQAAGPEGSCGAQAVSLLGRARRTLLRASRSGALASALETAQAPPLPPGVAQSAAAEWQRRREAEEKWRRELLPRPEIPVLASNEVPPQAAEESIQDAPVEAEQEVPSDTLAVDVPVAEVPVGSELSVHDLCDSTADSAPAVASPQEGEDAALPSEPLEAPAGGVNEGIAVQDVEIAESAESEVANVIESTPVPEIASVDVVSQVEGATSERNEVVEQPLSEIDVAPAVISPQENNEEEVAFQAEVAHETTAVQDAAHAELTDSTTANKADSPRALEAASVHVASEAEDALTANRNEAPIFEVATSEPSDVIIPGYSEAPGAALEPHAILEEVASPELIQAEVTDQDAPRAESSDNAMPEVPLTEPAATTTAVVSESTPVIDATSELTHEEPVPTAPFGVGEEVIGADARDAVVSTDAPLETAALLEPQPQEAPGLDRPLTPECHSPSRELEEPAPEPPVIPSTPTHAVSEAPPALVDADMLIKPDASDASPIACGQGDQVVPTPEMLMEEEEFQPTICDAANEIVVAPAAASTTSMFEKNDIPVVSEEFATQVQASDPDHAPQSSPAASSGQRTPRESEESLPLVSPISPVQSLVPDSDVDDIAQIRNGSEVMTVPSGELPVSGDAAVAFAAAEQASQAEASWTPSLGPAAPPSPAMAPMEEHTPHVAPEPWIPMVQSQQDPPWVEPPAYVAPESDGPFGPPAAEPAPWPTQAAAPTLAEAASESCAFPSSEVLPEREERIERLLGEIAALRAESSLGSPISSTPGPQDADVWRVERLCAEVQSLRNASDPNAQRVERLHAEVRNLRAAAAQDANLARAERLGAEVRTLRAASIQDPEAMRIARLEAEIQSLRAGAQDRTVAPMGGNAARAEYLLAELDATRRNVEAAQLQRLMQEVRGLQAQRSHAAGFIGSAAGGRAAEAAVRAERLLQELAALRRHGGMAGPAAQAQFAARRQHLLSELAALRAAASVPAGVPAGGPAQASSRYEPELAGNDVGELLEFLPEPSRPSAMSAGAVAAADDFGSEAFGFGGGPLQPPERRSGASAAPGAEAFGFGYQGPSAGFDDGTPRLSHLMPEPPLDPELSHFVPEFARASNMMPDLAHLIPEDAHLGQFMPEAQSNLAEFVPFTRSAPGSVDPDLMAFLPMIDPVAAAHNARNHGAGSLYPRQKAPPPHLLLLGAAAAGPVGGGGPYIEEVFTPRRN